MLLSSISSSIISSSAVSPSIVSSSAVSSSAISSTAISMVTVPGLPQYGAAMVATLIVVLSLKEILSSSQRWSNYLNNSFNLVLLPFVLTFVCIFSYKVMEIIVK